MSIQLYPSIAKIKRNGVYENLPGFVPETGSVATQQMIATAESSATAQYVHNKGEYFRLNDTLYQAIVKINVGDSIVVGTNCEVAVLGNDVTHIANSIAEYELGIATNAHNTGEYFMVGETLYVATSDIEIGDSISTSTNCRLAVVGDELSEFKSALNLNEWTPISAIKHSNGYIKATDGTVASETATDVFYTEYIDVSNYISIKYRMILTTSNVYTYTIGIAFYDTGKNYVTGFKGRGGQPSVGYQEDIIDVPNGCVYARFTGLTNTQLYGQFYVYGISKLYRDTYVENYFVVNKNLFDKTQVTEGKYIATNNGTIANQSTTFVSDFIPIKRGNTYSYRVAASLYGDTAAKRLALFASDKETFITYASGTMSDNIVTVKIANDSSYYSTASIPAYCRFTDYLYRIDSTMFVEGTYPSKYFEYGTDILSESFGLNDKQVSQIQTIINVGTLYGKKIAYNGDSIAESRVAEGNTYNGGAYAKMIADITNGTFENRAHGGGILASAPGDGGSTPHCIVSDVSNMADDADLICFEGGINDYWRDVPLGTYTESDYTSALDTTTICGALESIFRQATAKWIGKPICFVITHKITSTVYTDNTEGYDWTDVHEKIVGICKKYAIPYYDAFEESGLNAYNSVQNTNFLTSNSSGEPDGCHPNAEGYKKFYVPQLIALFESIMPKN